MLDQFTTELIALGKYLIDPNKRLFIGYLLGAALCAALVYCIQNRHSKSAKGFFLYLLNPRIWLHKSALLDYQLFIVNRVIRALLWAPLILTMVPIAIAVSDGLEWLFNTTEPLSNNQTLAVLVFTLVLFLFDDFTRFLLHYLMHRIPILWEFHKVHHSATVMTPMTVYRSHPVENFLYASRMAIAQGCAVGICYFVFGPTLSMADILGANVFIFLFNVMGSNLRHSHVKWRWGNAIEKWLISPMQHQIHHGREEKYHDKNFGTALAIWDRIFGTLVLSGNISYLVFGLGKNEKQYTSVLAAYVMPLVACKKQFSAFTKKYLKSLFGSKFY